jgi:hypothetical protein
MKNLYITLSSILLVATANTHFDTHPQDAAASYLYAPGMSGSEIAMARYCPQFTASTGEKITSKSGGHVIDQPHSAVTFPEIDLRKPTHFTLNPITAYINYLRRQMMPLVQRAMQDLLDFTVEDNPQNAHSVAQYNLDLSKANLGQKPDIKALQASYQEHIQQHSDTSVVLYGDSRGAATIFNFIALYDPAEVKAAVLEGIYDSLPHLVKHFIYSDKTPTQEKIISRIMRLVMAGYKKDGIDQRECAEIIADNIPLLFVISLKDGQVPTQSAFYLYNRLHARGHKKVHLLMLKNSFHPAYMLHDQQDKITYETVVHAFYKHYGLPHNSALAAQGEQEFLATQPTAEHLEATYKLPTCALCDATHAQQISMKKIENTRK